jgi:hypothetical protein
MLLPHLKRHLPGFSPAIALRKFHKRHYSKRIPHNTEDLFQISESHPEKHKLHEKLIAENTRVDTSSDMPRILYRPGLGIRKRLHVMRLMLHYQFKPLAPHVSKHLTACEKMLAMINETISNKIPVPFVHAHTIEKLSRKIYGKGAPRKEKVLHIVVGPAGSGQIQPQGDAAARGIWRHGH